MSKSVFLLFVAFVAKASGGPLNPFDTEIFPSNDASVFFTPESFDRGRYGASVPIQSSPEVYSPPANYVADQSVSVTTSPFSPEISSTENIVPHLFSENLLVGKHAGVTSSPEIISTENSVPNLFSENLIDEKIVSVTPTTSSPEITSTENIVASSSSKNLTDEKIPNVAVQNPFDSESNSTVNIEYLSPEKLIVGKHIIHEELNSSNSEISSSKNISANLSLKNLTDEKNTSDGLNSSSSEVNSTQNISLNIIPKLFEAHKIVNQFALNSLKSLPSLFKIFNIMNDNPSNLSNSVSSLSPENKKIQNLSQDDFTKALEEFSPGFNDEIDKTESDSNQQLIYNDKRLQGINDDVIDIYTEELLIEEYEVTYK